MRPLQQHRRTRFAAGGLKVHDAGTRLWKPCIHDPKCSILPGVGGTDAAVSHAVEDKILDDRSSRGGSKHPALKAAAALKVAPEISIGGLENLAIPKLRGRECPDQMALA